MIESRGQEQRERAITPTEYLNELYIRALFDQLNQGAPILAAFGEQNVKEWFLKPDSSVFRDRVSAMWNPTKLTPTRLHGGFIAETPGGFLGVALHTGDAEIVREKPSLKLEYAIANPQITPWMFKEQQPSSVMDLRHILYAMGGQQRHLGKFEVNEDQKLHVSRPLHNELGFSEKTLSDEGQKAWLSAQGLRNGLEDINRLVTHYQEQLQKPQ